MGRPHNRNWLCRLVESLLKPRRFPHMLAIVKEAVRVAATFGEQEGKKHLRSRRVHFHIMLYLKIGVVLAICRILVVWN